jgi:hypothetical protein
MEPIRTRSFGRSLANLRLRGLNARRRRGSRSIQGYATVRPQLKSAQVEVEPSVLDFLDINAELTYTTVVEGLEEFLYQKELPK